MGVGCPIGGIGFEGGWGVQKKMLDGGGTLPLLVETLHILLNISQIEGNQTMKFGPLIDHPKRNIFL